MENINKSEQLFTQYYSEWIDVYKKGAVRDVTLSKYLLTLGWLKKLVPQLKVCDIDRTAYQKLLNDYAACHEKQTTMDFHHQLKGAIRDAVDERLVEKDPTRKAIIKGIPSRQKKTKYLNQFELHTLINSLTLSTTPSWDWLILLIAKTGLRFSEAIALTLEDFDFSKQILSVNKTLDYKKNSGFLPIKNKSSVRKIQLDWQLVMQFAGLTKPRKKMI